MRTWIRRSLILLLLLCILPASIIPAAAEEGVSLPIVPKDQCSSPIRLEGNFHLTASFVLSAPRDTTAYLTLYLFDGETQEQSWNVLAISNTGARNEKTQLGENNPKRRWQETKFTKGKADKKYLQSNTTYHLSLRRWKQRILLEITDENDTSYGAVLYKAKADVSDTLYLQFSPGASTLTKAHYSIGKNTSFRKTVLENEGWVILASVGGVILLLILNFLFGALEKDIFEESFNVITGGLWGIAVLLAVCMVFPAGRVFLNNFIHGFMGISWITIPGPGSFWYWLLLILSIGYTLILWYLTVIEGDMSPLGGTLLMLLLGALHGFSLLFIVGIFVYLIVLVIGLAILVGLFGGSGGGDKESAPSVSKPPEPQPQKKAVRVWREDDRGNREYMKVGSSGEYYQDPETGEWHRISSD